MKNPHEILKSEGGKKEKAHNINRLIHESMHQLGADLPSAPSCAFSREAVPVNISITLLNAPDISSGMFSPTFRLMFPSILISGSPLPSPWECCSCPWYAVEPQFVNMLDKFAGMALGSSGKEPNGGGAARLSDPLEDWLLDSFPAIFMNMLAKFAGIVLGSKGKDVKGGGGVAWLLDPLVDWLLDSPLVWLDELLSHCSKSKDDS